MRGRTLLAAGAASALALVTPSAGAAIPSGAIVFASDRSPTLNVSHRSETFLANRQTLEVPKPAGTRSPNGRRTALVSSDAQGTVVVDAQSIPSGELHRLATFAPTDATLPAVSSLVWSPNGNWLAIVVDVSCRGVGGVDCNVYDLWAVRVDGSDLHEVSLHARGPTWSPNSSELAFFGNNVHGDEYIAYARAAGGPRNPLVPGEMPAWSTQGKAIAYAGPRGVQVVRVGRRGSRLLLPRRLTEPAVWSPDGRQLAVVTMTLSHNRQALHVVDVNRRHLRAIVAPSENSLPTLPRWSPNGKRLAFTATNGVAPIRNVFVANSNGTHRVRLTDLEPWFGFTSLAWSRDGQAVVYDASQYHDDLELFTMQPDGSGVRQLAGNARDDNAPSWSPDGKSILDEATNAIDGSSPGLFRIDAATGAETRLTTGDDHHPAWSPDGTAIAFSRWENATGAPQRIYLTDPTGTTLTPLTPPQQTVADLPAWSPDGKQLVYVDLAERALFLIDRDGTGIRQLTSIPFATNPAWSPDGKRIAFYGSEEAGQPYIYAINTDGTGLRRVVKSLSYILPRPAWSPDGTRLLYTSQPGSEDRILTSALGLAEFPAWSPAAPYRLHEHHLGEGPRIDWLASTATPATAMARP